MSCADLPSAVPAQDFQFAGGQRGGITGQPGPDHAGEGLVGHQRQPLHAGQAGIQLIGGEGLPPGERQHADAARFIQYGLGPAIGQTRGLHVSPEFRNVPEQLRTPQKRFRRLSCPDDAGVHRRIAHVHVMLLPGGWVIVVPDQSGAAQGKRCLKAIGDMIKAQRPGGRLDVAEYLLLAGFGYRTDQVILPAIHGRVGAPVGGQGRGAMWVACSGSGVDFVALVCCVADAGSGLDCSAGA